MKTMKALAQSKSKRNTLQAGLLMIPCLQAWLLGYSGYAGAAQVPAPTDIQNVGLENQALNVYDNQSLPDYTPTAFAVELQQSGYSKLAGYLQKQNTPDATAWNVVYVNVAQWRKADAPALRKAYEAGAVLLLDATESTSKKMSAASTAIGGLGLETPVLVMRYDHGKPDYRNIALDLNTPDSKANQTGSANYSELLTRAANRSSLTGPVSAILDTHFSVGKNADETRAAQIQAQAQAATPYAPIYTYYITTTTAFDCPLYEGVKLKADGSWNWKGSKINRCYNGYSELVWTVDLMRSVPAVAADGSSAIDAKYVRISILNNAGGSGIHLANWLAHYYTWKQSNAQWDDYIGPFANKYRFSVSPTNYSDLTLITHSPAQTNPQVTVEVTDSITIGVGASAGAEMDGSGPKAGTEVSASFAMTTSRTTTMAGSEYMVRNNTGATPGKAEWVWDRNYDTSLCDWASHHGTGSQCWFPAPVWDSSHIMNAAMFTPIAYSNFTPAFSVLYKTQDVNFTGTKNFQISAGVDIRGIAGSARYGALWQTRAVDGYNQVTRTLTNQTIAVDFSRPVYYPEVNVILQSLNESNSCIGVYDANTANGADVIKSACTSGKSQFWGLNSSEQYVSRVYPDRCLTVKNPTALIVSTCQTTDLGTKWYWNGNTLMSRYVDTQGNRDYRLAIVNGDLQLIREDQLGSTDWNNYMVNPN